ncbi:MAG: hypothetical protein EZS28_015713 [Streblomastix strix]|uniref:Uncharacterized protein n=1 Tax=Streblomastix strix TaxID=222440 RepID=A0A5J4W2R6_9EUKA|nr:MAG: hypothetical protein EZS28_015713 [Streblomastix strix]
MFFVLDLLFHTQARFILSEILRISSTKLVFFRTFSYDGTSLPAAVQQIFTLVPPRRQIQRPLAQTDNPYYISLDDAYIKINCLIFLSDPLGLEEFPDPLGPVGDPTTKHIRLPPTPTSGLQPSRFSEPCFALSMIRRGNALDRLIVTNGRIVVIGSFDNDIQSTIIPTPAFHHQPFVEPYPIPQIIANAAGIPGTQEIVSIPPLTSTKIDPQ